MNPMLMMGLMTLASAAASKIGGKDEKHGSTYNKGQRGTLNDLIQQIKGSSGAGDITQNQGYQQGQDWLSSLFNDQDFFNKFEAPMQRDFQENTVPDLANRFASMGSGGSLGSTGFRNQLAREGSNLHTNIAAMRGNMQQQGVGQQLGYAQQPTSNYMQMISQALGLQPNNTYQGASPGMAGNVMGSLAGAASSGYGQQWGQNMAGGGGMGMQQPQNLSSGGQPYIIGQYPGTR